MAAHQEYFRAGAQLLRTNSKGAERVTLERYGMDERTEAINNSASALLQSATTVDILKMGVIGQIRPDPRGTLADGAARERAYSEQLVYLSDTGVTFFLLEHFQSLEEALLVVRTARRCSDAPVLAQLQFSPEGNTSEGTAALEAARMLVDAGAGAVGVGCMEDWALLDVLADQMLTLGVPVSLMPGNPGTVRETPPPGEYAARMVHLAGRGVQILGGCCGITPDHIQALRQGVASARD